MSLSDCLPSVPQSTSNRQFAYDTPEEVRTMCLPMRKVIAWACLGLAFAARAGASVTFQAQTPNAIHQTPPGLGQFPYSDADVDFMSGMIPHHAQAVIMAGWAPTRGARRDVAVLC